MLKSERIAIEKWAESLTDKELEVEFYESLLACLGSQAEKMYELDFDIRDIKEREKYEKFLCEKNSLIGEICLKRGIELFC